VRLLDTEELQEFTRKVMRQKGPQGVVPLLYGSIRIRVKATATRTLTRGILFFLLYERYDSDLVRSRVRSPRRGLAIFADRVIILFGRIT